MSRRVVITGLGTVNPLGNSVSEFWYGLESCNQPNQGNLSEYLKQLPRLPQLHSTGPDFEQNLGRIKTCWVQQPEDLSAWYREYFGRFSKWGKRLQRAAVYGTVAGGQALRDAGLLPPSHLEDSGKNSGNDNNADSFALQHCDPFRTGTLLANESLNFASHEYNQQLRLKSDIAHQEPLYVLNGIANVPTGLLLQVYGLRGAGLGLASGGASSLQAMILAKSLIENDFADVMLAGGSETPLSATVAASLAKMGILQSPAFAQLGEAAALLCLEEREHALARGATIYAELLGATSSQQVVESPRALWSSLLEPDKKDIAENFQQCLSESFASTGKAESFSQPLLYCSYSPESTAEVSVVKSLLSGGSPVQNALPDISVQNLKPLLGNCFAASAALELIAALAPENILQKTTAEIPPKPAQRILCYQYGLGGSHASILLGRE